MRFIVFGAWRSLVAHLLWEQGVGGSNPLAPTSLRSLSYGSVCCHEGSAENLALFLFLDRNLLSDPD
jgi:hypothetical protein